MSANPLQPSLRNYLWLLATGAIATIVVIVLGIVLSTVHQSWASLKNELQSSPVTEYTEGDWAIRQLSDATIETPFDFGPGPDYLAQMPAESRDLMEFSDTYRSLNNSDSFGVMVLRRGLKPHVAPDLDGSLRRPFQGIAQKLGDSRPSFNFRPAMVSGFPAVIARYHRQKLQPDDEEKLVLAAAVADGQIVWQIIIIYADESMTADAERILNSFKIR